MMRLTDQQLSELAEVARLAALDAGTLIASYAGRPYEVGSKSGGASVASQIVTSVDREAEALIVKRLSPSLAEYDLALLTEEQEDDRQRLVKDYFWCVDPMDGTLAFTQSLPGYTVSIALVSKTGVPVIGVVYDPLEKLVYSAVKGQGADRNGKPLSTVQRTDEDYFFLPCDRSLTERDDFGAFMDRLAREIKEQGMSGVMVIESGGAVYNACKVLEHKNTCYFKLPKDKPGGGSLWDFAATACIFSELGMVATSFSGQPLDLNRADSTFMNHAGVIYSVDEEAAELVRGVWRDINKPG